MVRVGDQCPVCVVRCRHGSLRCWSVKFCVVLLRLRKRRGDGWGFQCHRYVLGWAKSGRLRGARPVRWRSVRRVWQLVCIRRLRGYRLGRRQRRVPGGGAGHRCCFWCVSWGAFGHWVLLHAPWAGGEPTGTFGLIIPSAFVQSGLLLHHGDFNHRRCAGKFCHSGGTGPGLDSIDGNPAHFVIVKVL